MTEQDLLTSQWQLVASALGVDFVGPFEFPSATSHRHKFAGLLPQFGGTRGTLIDVEYNREAVAAAVAAGFSHSTMGAEHHHLPVEPSNYIECLVEWGWTATARPPRWYLDASHEA